MPKQTFVLLGNECFKSPLNQLWLESSTKPPFIGYIAVVDVKHFFLICFVDILQEKGPISVAPSSRLNCRKSIHCSFVFVCLFQMWFLSMLCLLFPMCICVSTVNFSINAIVIVHTDFICLVFQMHLFIDFWTIQCAIEESYFLRGVRFRVSFIFLEEHQFPPLASTKPNRNCWNTWMQAVRFKACWIFLFGE